ncbi:hypothetical protein PF010_g16798 [Phytophthora fragariae]|uniref:P-type ATPase N-terminal domain-containing protein n=2 Tax=Phytophthora fragariae TaxID=53985 RepID=A0A6A3EFS4_9STRA|nr:hypothetical protein PF009_g18827 [Phytophthora fragariae]KAE8994097.1 hypothetical protein PF011_g16867 [Phytophthora fragariae]KAE9094201.1 hypothetical protein PF007_g17847 [Phytophthora fragariae]KAE9095205.1 hypothetical protein PF010_g16798 [Phytophthora fragariae]KAE9208243.1 hypothetical protein PF002_g19464 [Phytophthora fragariae]
MSSLLSTDSQGAPLGQRKQYKIVEINDAGNAPSGSRRAQSPTRRISTEVKTSQYTWWTFVTVFLYLTFQKTANLYFLLVGIFQIIPSVSPTDGVPLQFSPLVIVIVIDAIFAGYEDYKRHMANDLAISAKTRVFNLQLREFEEVDWRELKVGDFVVANHEILPADIMILAVIPAEGSRSGGNMGLCYVETKNLDGETNLKLREAPQPTRNMFTNEDEAGKLRNTSYMYGLEANTGTDSKIMMSSGDEFSIKVSSIDEMTNKRVIVVVIILVAMSLTGAIEDIIWISGLNLPTYLKLGSWDDSFMEAFVYLFATLASMGCTCPSHW